MVGTWPEAAKVEAAKSKTDFEALGTTSWTTTFQPNILPTVNSVDKHCMCVPISSLYPILEPMPSYSNSEWVGNGWAPLSGQFGLSMPNEKTSTAHPPSLYQ